MKPTWVEAYQESKKLEKEREVFTNPTLDQMLSLDRDNLQVLHSDVESVNLVSQPEHIWTTKGLYVSYFVNDGNSRKLEETRFVFKRGMDYEPLKSALQEIDALSGKFHWTGSP